MPIAARVTDELQKLDAYEDFDSSILEEMLRASQVKTVTIGITATLK